MVKWIPESRTLELSQRNVNTLLLKLDDPASARTLIAPASHLHVRAVENADDTDSRVVHTLSKDIAAVVLTRSDLQALRVVGTEILIEDLVVQTVSDSDHYGDRPPGEMYMPTSGETF